MDGKPMPKSITEGQPIAQLQGKRNNLTCLGPQHDFQSLANPANTFAISSRTSGVWPMTLRLSVH